MVCRFAIKHGVPSNLLFSSYGLSVVLCSFSERQDRGALDVVIQKDAPNFEIHWNLPRFEHTYKEQSNFFLSSGLIIASWLKVTTILSLSWDVPSLFVHLSVAYGSASPAAWCPYRPHCISAGFVLVDSVTRHCWPLSVWHANGSHQLYCLRHLSWWRDSWLWWWWMSALRLYSILNVRERSQTRANVKLPWWRATPS